MYAPFVLKFQTAVGILLSYGAIPELLLIGGIADRPFNLIFSADTVVVIADNAITDEMLNVISFLVIVFILHLLSNRYFCADCFNFLALAAAVNCKHSSHTVCTAGKSAFVVADNQQTIIHRISPCAVSHYIPFTAAFLFQILNSFYFGDTKSTKYFLFCFFHSFSNFN